MSTRGAPVSLLENAFAADIATHIEAVEDIIADCDRMSQVDNAEKQTAIMVHQSEMLMAIRQALGEYDTALFVADVTNPQQHAETMQHRAEMRKRLQKTLRRINEWIQVLEEKWYHKYKNQDQLEGVSRTSRQMPCNVEGRDIGECAHLSPPVADPTKSDIAVHIHSMAKQIARESTQGAHTEAPDPRKPEPPPSNESNSNSGAKRPSPVTPPWRRGKRSNHEARCR